MPLYIEPAVCLSASPARLQYGIQVDFQNLQGWRQSKKHAGQHRNDQGEQQHLGIDPDLIDPRNIAGVDRADRSQAQAGHYQSARSAQQAEYRALGEQLPYQPMAARPYGGS